MKHFLPNTVFTFLLLVTLIIPECSFGETKTVLVKDFVYDPVILDINEGDTVVWDGIDDFHDVNSGVYPNPNGIFSSGSLNRGNSYAFTFFRDVINSDTALNDTFEYYCGPHVAMGMVGTIRVARVAKSLRTTLTAWQADIANSSSETFSCSLTVNAPETQLSINCDPGALSISSLSLYQGTIGTNGTLICSISGTSGSCNITHAIADSLLAVNSESYLVTTLASGTPLRGQITKIGGSQTVSGKVRLRGVVPLSGVVISDGVRSATTGADGSYSFQGVTNGSYRLSAVLEGYTITPLSGVTPFVVNSNDVTFRDFTASPITTEVRLLGDIDGDLIADPIPLNKKTLTYESSSLGGALQTLFTTTDSLALAGYFFAQGQTSLATISKSGKNHSWKFYDTKGTLINSAVFGAAGSTPIGGCDFNGDGLTDIAVRTKKSILYSTDLGTTQIKSNLSAARVACRGTFFDDKSSIDTNGDGIADSIKITFLNGKSSIQVGKKKFILANGKILSIFGYEGLNNVTGLFYQDDKGTFWSFNFTTLKKTKLKLQKSKKASLVIY